MLAYSAYASVCHASNAKSRFASFAGLCFHSVVFSWVCFFGPYLLQANFEFERQTFGRCTVVNSFVKRCAHKICALFMALNAGERTQAPKRDGLDLA